MCLAVACPSYSVGTDVPSGCVCNPGYSGTVTASSSSPYYASTCAPNVCVATQVTNSNKSSSGSIAGTTGASVTVVCNAGWSGGGVSTCGSNGVFDTLICSRKYTLCLCAFVCVVYYTILCVYVCCDCSRGLSCRLTRSRCAFWLHLQFRLCGLGAGLTLCSFLCVDLLCCCLSKVFFRR